MYLQVSALPEAEGLAVGVPLALFGALGQSGRGGGPDGEGLLHRGEVEAKAHALTAVAACEQYGA